MDTLTRDFYRRGWRFRLFCNRKSSKDNFLNRVEIKYGKDCVLYYGDWSRKDQMPGCSPSPTVGIRKLLSKRFAVIEVDEFRTSVTV